MSESSPAVREQHWQAAWRARGLGRAVAVVGRPKYYILFAYPGPSGFQHVGHMRGFSYADSFARYHRMRGEAVFFPGGTHASGLPAITFSAKVARGDADILAELRSRGLSETDIHRLEVPEEAARFLGEDYWNLWERFGMLMDRTSHVTTIDADYQRFITWQFTTLKALGRLVQKPYFAPYCPRSGPVSVDPSETDLSSGGTAEMVTYTLVPFTLPDGRILLTATLRPETVYGVTNLWLPPSGTLTEWAFGGKTYLVSPSAATRLTEQLGGTRGGSVDVGALTGSKVTVPITGAEVSLFQSSLVQPGVGTGVVMSVPAHAPADWVAVQALAPSDRDRLTKDIRPIIEVSESGLGPSDRQVLQGEGVPAARVVAALAIKDLGDSGLVQEATARLYRIEMRAGLMTVGEYRGEPVATVRERIARQLFPEGARVLREFSEKVICRCGEEVTIRRVPDQWFLAYGSSEWKSRVIDQVQRMGFHPREYRDELPGIIEWFEDRPAVRKGRWLGTPFPLDPSWTIEPIADSTFYPAYYIIRRFVAQGELRVDDLTNEFFDYVFLGKGSGGNLANREVLERARREFLYWYPVDINLGGKEHKRVHFPVFLYVHAAMLPAELQPRGIFINWWMTNYSGDKLSKKDQKGGAVPPVDVVLATYGADGLRLYYSLSASPFQDIQWEETQCRNARARLDDILRMLTEIRALPEPTFGTDALTAHIDRWFSSRLHAIIHEVRRAWDDYDLRTVAQDTYVALPTLFRRYSARGGSNTTLLRRAAETWSRLLSPITPHIAEEARALFVPSGTLAAEGIFPTGEEFASHPISMVLEQVVEQLEEDVGSLLKIWTKSPARLDLFVAAPWKYRAVELIPPSMTGGRLDMKSFMERARQDPQLVPWVGELAKFGAEYRKEGESSRWVGLSASEERSILDEARPFLSKRFHIPQVSVCPEEEGTDTTDPGSRRKRARPGHPAIVLS